MIQVIPITGLMLEYSKLGFHLTIFGSNYQALHLI